MTDLSPAAQAVLEAVEEAFSNLSFAGDESPISTWAMSLMAATALRAAVKEIGAPGLGAVNLKRKLLAIAYELEDR